MVASISACNDPHYYLQVDHALYYLTGEAGAGVWHGEGARLLGFTGTVVSDQLIAAFCGLGSDSYTRHVQLPEGRNHQPAWDMTLSPPKSVSVLWSVLGAADRHKIEALLMQAAKTAVNYLDSAALLTRRGKGGKQIEHAKGVYALCPHGTSRSQDPQLHVHALIMNMCVREDGTTGTIRSKDLYLHKMAAGALFRLELARLLSQELGLTVEQDKWSFKIAGVPDSLCDEQSKRRQIIEQIAKEEGWTSPRLLAELAIKTRDAKGQVSMSQCLKSWQEAGRKHRFGRQAAEKLLATAARGTSEKLSARLRTDYQDKQLQEALRESIELLSQSQSYFPERDLIQQVAAALQASGLTTDEIVDAVKEKTDGFEHRLEIAGSPYRYYATPETLAAERELLSLAEQGRKSLTHGVSDATLAKAKRTVEKRLSEKIGFPTTLTFDQETSLIHITQEQGSTKLVQGYAGTGKTQMLEAANLAWKAAGYQVLGTSITGRAALGLQQATAIPSVTVCGLLRSLRPEITQQEMKQLFPQKMGAAIRGAYYEGFRAGAWMKNPFKQALKEIGKAFGEVVTGPRYKTRPSYQLNAKTILVVDEAGMLPTKALLAIQQACHKVGAKLVLVGDRLQLPPPIEAGGPFASLSERLGCQYLTTVIRQRKEWMREAVYALIQNDPRQALDLYAANNSLRLEKSQQAATSRLIADYGTLTSEEYGKSLAVVSTRREATQINAGIQERRKASLQLGSQSIVLPNGERVFENDRIMVTKNDYQLDVRNGLLGTVVGIEQGAWRTEKPKLEVRLDGQQEQGFFSTQSGTVLIDLAKYSDVQLGYAATTHKIQGITVDSSYVLLGESMLNKEMAFTQLTRASLSTTIYGAEAQYGNTLEQLASRLSFSTAKDLAHDHKVVIQSEHSIQQRQALLQEAGKRLLPQPAVGAEKSTAYLADIKLSSSQYVAVWKLLGDYQKLHGSDYEKSIAIVTDTAEATRINQGIQAKRKTAKELSVDSLKLPHGERVFKGDRVLLAMDNEQGVSKTLLGTAVGMRFGRGVLSESSLTIQLDMPYQTGTLAGEVSQITVAASDFSKLQVGYAATAEKLKEIAVESSFVLLPEGGETPEEIRTQLTRATRDVSIYGLQSQYGPLLDAGNEQGTFAQRLRNTSMEATTNNASLLRVDQKMDVNKQLDAEEQNNLQQKLNEQAELSWKQSFTL